MIQDYDLLNLIGEGSFGRVYKARRKFTGRLVAIKLINKLGQNADDLQTLRREIDILSNVNHNNIMKMIDVFETDTNFCIVTELARGDLFQVIDDDQVLPEEALKPIAAQLVSALCHLHKNHIIHRDLKPQNILVSSNGTIKVCDFGFARALSQTTLMLTSIKGTPLYMAPELVQEQPYNESIDIWSLGIILFELFHGRPPFYTESIYKLMQMIINNSIKYPDTMSEEFRSFLQLMLEKDPAHRSTAEELLYHPFINNIDISIYNASLYNYKSKQFEKAIKESLLPDSNTNFHPPKSKTPDYKMIFLSPSSYSTEEIREALKYLLETRQQSESPLVASFATNFSHFLRNSSIIAEVIKAATYVLHLDKERYTPSLLAIADLLGTPNMSGEMIPLLVELMATPYAECKYMCYHYDSSFLNIDEERAAKLRDFLLSLIFTHDIYLQIDLYNFMAFLLQVSPLFLNSVCGDFTPQIVPLIVSAFSRSESKSIKTAALSILSQLIEMDPTTVFFIQPLDPFFDAIKDLISDDPESPESLCCFSVILTFFKTSFREIKSIPKFKAKFDEPQNLSDFIYTIFNGIDNFSNRLSLLLMFAAQTPSSKTELLGYVSILQSPFEFLVIDQKDLETCANFSSALLPYHQPSLINCILKLEQDTVLSVLPAIISLFESQTATSIMSSYFLDIITPEIADELLENDCLLYLSHVIAEMGPEVPAPTVLVLAKIILSFTEAGTLLLEQSREVLTAIFSIDMAAESGLIIAAHLARISPSFIPALTECGALNLAARALLADISRVRGRALDFIGNYCKHSPIPSDFIKMITSYVTKQLVCDDLDCKKLAAYALSNIIFHSPELIDSIMSQITLDDIISNFKTSLSEDDINHKKLTENLVALCGNLVRKSDKYLQNILQSQILITFLDIIKKGGKTGSITLLHLSVFCQYESAINFLKEKGTQNIIKPYADHSNERVQRTARKLLQIF